ncbi:type IV secretion system protein TrbL [Pseudovibrio sp. Tun.PSC04-5.I4]|nr:type IV secretion system protein TrbL [Pseudovibrio sp. Tun.PSC04-5.I4]
MSNACISCPLIEKYVESGDQYVNGLMNIAYDPMVTIFASLACLWAVWQGFKLVTGTTDMSWVVTQFVFIFFGFGVLTALKFGLAGQVYTATTTLMFGIPGALMGAGSGTDAITGLVSNLETAFTRPFSMGKAMMNGAGWLDKAGVVLFVAALMLPFILMMIAFVTHVAIGLFRVMIVCLLAPYVIAISAFPFGRDKIGAGISTLLSAILTLVAVSLVFLLVIAGVGSLMPAGQKLSTDIFQAETWGKYVLVILTAWSGVALVQEAVSLAGTLAQVTLNAATPGMMMSGVGQTAGAYGKGIGMAGKGVAKGYEKLRDMYVGKKSD